MLSIVMMFADHQFDYLSRVRFYASYGIRPVQWLTDAPIQLGNSVQETLQSRAALEDENKALRQQLFMQQYQLSKLTYLTAEVQRLNQLQHASAIVKEREVQAQIVGESPDPFQRRVMINKGKRDGVYIGQPVHDAYGLMGMIVEIEAYDSWVMLVTDPNHSTPVQINRNGVRTMAAGSEENPNELELLSMARTADVMVGDVLETSGFGQNFPVGLPVGIITSVEHDPGQPFAIIKAVPLAHLSSSRNVLLIF